MAEDLPVQALPAAEAEYTFCDTSREAAPMAELPAAPV